MSAPGCRFAVKRRPKDSVAAGGPDNDNRSAGAGAKCARLGSRHGYEFKNDRHDIEFMRRGRGV